MIRMPWLEANPRNVNCLKAQFPGRRFRFQAQVAVLEVPEQRVRRKAVPFNSVAMLLVDVPLSPLRILGTPIEVVVRPGVLQPLTRTGRKTFVFDDGPIVFARRPDDVALNPRPVDWPGGIGDGDITVDDVGWGNRPAAGNQFDKD